MPYSDELVDAYASLFKGRLEAYGSEDGECIKVPQWTYPNYLARIREHLEGDSPMGVYPMIPDSGYGWVCNWGCVDFDEGEEASWTYARNLQTVLEHLSITSHIERSRSKGYHVWVFAESPITCAVMRQALLGATQIAQAPLKEINPKSTGFSLDDGRMDIGKFGNYVRLPYPAHHSERRVIVDSDGFAVPVELFVSDATTHRTDVSVFEAAAELYVPPPKPKRSVVVDLPDEPSEDLPDAWLMSQKTRNLFRLGPFEDRHDRSGALWRLTHLLMDDGYSPSETLQFLRDADARWGKFTARGDEQRLADIIRKVYA